MKNEWLIKTTGKAKKGRVDKEVGKITSSRENSHRIGKIALKNGRQASQNRVAL